MDLTKLSRKIYLIIRYILYEKYAFVFFFFYKLVIDPIKFKFKLEVKNPFIKNRTIYINIDKIKKFLIKKKTIKILEIGTNLGEFSFKLHDYLLKKKIKFKIISVDPFLHDFRFVSKSYIYKIFKHNLSLKNRSKNIKHLKLKSLDAFKFFKKKKFKFDLIFIDGSHLYKDVMNDLKFSIDYKKNYKTEVFLDDLDYTYEELLKIYKNKKVLDNLLKKSLKINYIKDKVNFHPGTLLGVKELNIKISNKKYGSLSRVI